MLRGYTDTNIVKEVPSPRGDKGAELRTIGRDEILKPAQVWAIAERLPEWAANVCLVLAQTALRGGEAAALLVDDWNPATGTLHVSKSWSPFDGIKVPKTKQGNRTLTIGRTGREVIDRAAGDQRRGGDKPLLLAARRPQHFHPPSFRRAFVRALRECGYPDHFRVHTLRHSAISWWLAAGQSIDEVAKAAGHSSVYVTLTIYRHHHRHASGDPLPPLWIQDGQGSRLAPVPNPGSPFSWPAHHAGVGPPPFLMWRVWGAVLGGSSRDHAGAAHPRDSASGPSAGEGCEFDADSGGVAPSWPAVAFHHGVDSGLVGSGRSGAAAAPLPGPSYR